MASSKPENFSDTFKASFDILRRTRPERVGAVLKSLIKIMEAYGHGGDVQNLVNYVPLPAKVIGDGPNKFLGVAQNANGIYYRKPAHRDYVPAVQNSQPEPQHPAMPVHFNQEQHLNALFTNYGKQYANRESTHVSSVYTMGSDASEMVGIAALLINPPSDKMTGRYQSTNTFQVHTMSGKQSDVTNTTTISLFLKTTDAKHKIEMSLMGTMTSSTTGKITDMKMMIPQLMSIIETSENSALSKLKVMYFGRLKELSLRARGESDAESVEMQRQRSKEMFNNASKK